MIAIMRLEHPSWKVMTRCREELRESECTALKNIAIFFHMEAQHSRLVDENNAIKIVGTGK